MPDSDDDPPLVSRCRRTAVRLLDSMVSIEMHFSDSYDAAVAFETVNRALLDGANVVIRCPNVPTTDH